MLKVMTTTGTMLNKYSDMTTWIRTLVMALVLAGEVCASGAQSSHHLLIKRGLFGPRPSGTVCAFDPCGIASFCSGGRYCELDEFCRHHCTCTEESTHESCTENTLSADPLRATTTPSVICAFNPCTIPNFCGTGRRCEIDKQCMYSCVCTDESTHEMCSTETYPSSESTSRLPDIVTEVTPSVTPISDDSDTDSDIDGGNACPPGFPCENGQCLPVDSGNNVGIRCHCHDGWAGLSCEKEKRTECNKNCDTGFECVFISNLVEACVQQDVTNAEFLSADDISTNVCSSEYRPRNATEQTCKYGMTCKFGVCVETDGGVVSRCECDPGAYDQLCQETCCLDCGEHGECMVREEVGEMCNCHYNYTGADCTVLKPTEEAQAEPTWHWWVVGVSGLVLVMLLVMMVLVPYAMWKHRVILIMKIVHYFQQYEDDDEREWDVFVSYKSSERDEKFVVHTLLPKLEDELGFKLNVHFRDFIIGMDIADNIVNAVQGSRRTILIISPKYITSEWTKFEYQIAQQEMLNRKNRIIPILIDDICDCTSSMDPSLKMLLGSVTYLEYPHDDSDKKTADKFWKRLQLTLPKKREVKEMSSSSKSTGNFEISVLHSKETETNGCVLKLSDSIKDTDDVYAIIDDSKLNIEFESEHNKQESGTCIDIPNGSTTHV